MCLTNNSTIALLHKIYKDLLAQLSLLIDAALYIMLLQQSAKSVMHI